MKPIASLAALCAAATFSVAHAQGPAPAPASPAKKELVQKLMQLQQPEIEQLARSMAERPAAQLMQSAAEYMQVKMPPEQRPAAQKKIEADVKKYVDEVTPLLRERALKLAPGAIGAAYEEKFTEAELQELIIWFSSPTNRKFQQLGAEMQTTFVQRLVTDTQPVTRPRLVALDGKIRGSLGLPAEPPAADAAASGAPRANRPVAPAPRAPKP